MEKAITGMHININRYLKDTDNNYDQHILYELEARNIQQDYNYYNNHLYAKMNKKYNKIRVLRSLIVFC